MADLTLDTLIDRAAQINPDAGRFLRDMFSVAHAWDDLTDRDKPFDEAATDNAFEALLVRLPMNPFYTQHINLLHPIVMMAVLNWQMATRLERKADADTERFAYVLRSSYADLFPMVFWILKGKAAALDAAEEARRAVHSESICEYRAALVREKAEREVL